MLDFPSMLWVKLPVVDRIHPQSNKFAVGVENETTGNSKLNESPAYACWHVVKQQPSMPYTNLLLSMLYS